MYEYFYIGFIDFILKGKSFLDYTIFFLLIIMKKMIKTYQTIFIN